MFECDGGHTLTQLQEQLESRRFAADQLLAGCFRRIRFSVLLSTAGQPPDSEPVAAAFLVASKSV